MGRLDYPGDYVLFQENGLPKVCFTKVTGNEYVPAGRISVKTEGIPVIGDTCPINAFWQARQDKNDQDAFFWSNVKLTMPTPDKIEFVDEGDDTFTSQTTLLLRYKTEAIE